MNSPSPHRWISQFIFGFFFAYGVYLPFWALWYEGQRISAPDIGILIGIGFATRCVANLVLTPRFHLAEQFLPVLRIFACLSASFIALYYFVEENFWLLALATVLFNLCCGLITALSDSMANYYSRLKILDYGRTRLWGSVAFIVGSTVVGYLISFYGTGVIVVTALVGTLASVLCSFRNTNPMPASNVKRTSNRPKVFSQLKDWQVIKFLLLTSLIQGSHAAYYSFSSIHWKSAGISGATIGYLWSLGVIAEIMVFALSKYLFANRSLRAMFVISSIGVIVRWVLTALSTEVALLVVVQLLHGVTFATAHLATIRYIEQSEESRTVVLQALYNAIPLGAFIAIMTAISGWGYEYWGANIFWLMALMGGLALFIRIDRKPLPSLGSQLASKRAEEQN
ncbi:3-phenylpropionate MFS transporter [Vibrio sp. S4M6]|uniref:3-phenylpropionate MFS transporter n=1 Tax=Vibrio sinus TaxID=2946865 RepID=UPI00202A4DAD|nr:3-phenylpropionate MFS transporter [Vibrio sinus]MCL9783516.1 3-phenylpropionate MFS transporter [Vibrio sinus]